MKTLVLYYSYEGSTEYVAKLIAKKLDAKLEKITPEKEMKSKGFMKFFWGGRSVFIKEKPKLLPLENNPEGFDVIFIGTPVWAFNFTPPIRSFFENYKLKDKKIALFCTYEGGKGKTLENMRKELKGNEIIGEVDFNYVAREKDKGKIEFQLYDWLDGLEL